MLDGIASFFRPRTPHCPLPDNATIVVVGAGPAGSFFAIRTLRKARRLGRKLDLIILERKHELHFYQGNACGACREGCNYCAGGISPKLADLLRKDGLKLPEDVITGRAESLTVHGDWKSIELPIPPGKDMLFVFRGSRPRGRPGRHENFDAFLLSKAVEEGARVITGEAHGLGYSSAGRPLVRFWPSSGQHESDITLEADLVVVAAGVNQMPGMHLGHNTLFQSLTKVIPGFRPPKVRKSLIVEMEAEDACLGHMRGEVHFAQYGSNELQIEMSSLIPKGKWTTIALLGRSVDQADPSRYLQVIEQFLQLPHIRRLFPRRVRLVPVCLCHPNMTVGPARNPSGNRIAVIGDMVVSRLYKDGILSAYITASALADCALDVGVDQASLKRGYRPVVRRFAQDNIFGAVAFMLNRITFSHPMLSRIVYQAVVTERKTKPAADRRLANVLWRIASGDDSYRHILLSMFHPATIWLLAVGGLAVTIRNYLTECLFGLKWEGFGRYATGIPKESVERKRLELAAALGVHPFSRAAHFERVYSIKITAGPSAILRELDHFGDTDRRYFNPRLLNVYRTAGAANTVGSTIRYDVALGWLSFSIVLEKVIGSRYLLYRVKDGFARGGILVFDIEQKQPGLCILSIYVAFDFPQSGGLPEKFGWWLFGLLFPAFVHDVLWNHALCELKDAVEGQAASGQSQVQKQGQKPGRVGILAHQCSPDAFGPENADRKKGTEFDQPDPNRLP